MSRSTLPSLAVIKTPFAGWIRSGPILCRLVEGIRDRRLAAERRERIKERQNIVEDEYNDVILRVLPWAMMGFIPPPSGIWTRPGFESIKKILDEDDTTPSAHYHAAVRRQLV